MRTLSLKLLLTAVFGLAACSNPSAPETASTNATRKDALAAAAPLRLDEGASFRCVAKPNASPAEVAASRGLCPQGTLAMQEPVRTRPARADSTVVSTTPAANAVKVRPDTVISIQYDTDAKNYTQWSRKLASQATLTLLNDGGSAVYTATTDDELRFDAAAGTLTFTPPAHLDRYTTYAVLVTTGAVPEFLRPAADKDRKALPRRPDFKVEALDPDAVGGPPETAQLTMDGEPQPAGNCAAPDAARMLAAAQAELVGPLPVRAVDANLRPLKAEKGGQPRGVVQRIEGNLVTLFGGEQFTLDEDTRVHVPSLPGADTVADLQPGDLVKLTVNAQGRVVNVGVLHEADTFSFVFRTGSALHEPTQVAVEVVNPSPRVTEGGRFVLVSTDDYGLPAWGSVTSIELKAENGVPLHGSAEVLPGPLFTTTDASGRTEVTVVDHFPQVVTAKVSMNGPYYDGYDAHGFAVTFSFRPGLPALLTLKAPETLEVGTSADLSGTVVDIYGNPVEDGSELLLTASAGDISSPIVTAGGEYHATYTAATLVQVVSIAIVSAEGGARASTSIQLLPGAPARMVLEGPATVQAGEGILLSGSVRDVYGNAVADGSRLLFSASAGTVNAEAFTSQGGFTVRYGAPTRAPQGVQVAGASVRGSASAVLQLAVVPGPVASLTLQAERTRLYTGEMTPVGGQVADRYDNLIEGLAVRMAARYGALSTTTPASDSAGLYGALYTAPFYNGVDTVSAEAGTLSASVDLNISSAGWGVDPVTGEVRRVARLAFEQVTYSTTPGQAIVLAGHAHDADGRPLQAVVLSSASATVGGVEAVSYQTDAAGRFTVTYRAPGQQASATVTVASASVTASTTVNTLAHGYGYNPQTGQWEKVASITLDNATLVQPRQYSASVFPSSSTVFTGHAYNAQGEPLAQVRFDKLTATAGTATLGSPTTDDTGAFTLTYAAPSTEGNRIVQIGSGDVVTSLVLSVSSLGYGYNPGTGAWERVASIVFSPTAYTVSTNSTVTLTGRALNASGQVLVSARIQLSATGGSVPSSVTTQNPSGTFSAGYTAPGSAGTRTVRASVSSAVSATATVTVTAPLPPKLVNAFINLYGSTYGRYFSGTAYWGGTAQNGDGTPLRDGYYNGTRLEAILQRGAFLAPIAETYPSYSGTIDGPPAGVEATAGYYSVDRYGRTWHFFIYLTMGLWDGAHYQGTGYYRSYNLRSYESCYCCYVWCRY